MNILWTQPTGSGLADRLTDYLLMSAYGKVHNATVYSEWTRFPASAIDVKHRSVDILLSNVTQFMRFPSNLCFDKPAVIDKTFNHYIGGTTNNVSFHEERLSGVCSLEQFIDAVKESSKQFTFCDQINEYLKTLPDRFIAFHIRRGDKVRNEPHDGAFINSSELEWLDALTYRALDHYLNEGHTTIFMCGDEDDKTAPFANYAKDSGAVVFSTPAMEKWQSTYYDLATMTKSIINVTSQRYSSFSRFPSLIGNGLYFTVPGLEKEGFI